MFNSASFDLILIKKHVAKFLVFLRREEISKKKIDLLEKKTKQHSDSTFIIRKYLKIYKNFEQQKLPFPCK